MRRAGAGAVLGLAVVVVAAGLGVMAVAGDDDAATPVVAGGAGSPGPFAVVVSQHGVMGWWDGESWRDPVDWSGGLPYAHGDTFTVAHLDGTTTTATAGEARSEEFCYPSGTNGIAFDPEVPLTWTGDVDWIAVRADWDVVPRPTTSLDATSPSHVDAVEEQLRAAGIEGQPIVIVQALRTDLDGDGVDEVILTAEHPDADRGNPPRAGWYGMVLLRRVVAGEVVTTPLSLTAYTEDDNSYPTMAQHRVSAVADLNGDGRMEIVTGTDYFEGGESRVFDVVDGPARVVLTGSCGV